VKRIVQILLIGMLPLTVAWAQNPVADEQDDRRYTVEMIIFTYAQDVATAGEVFLPDPVIEEGFNDTAVEPGALDERGKMTEPLPELEFVRLNRSELTMNDVMGHLRRIDIYRPVMHFGWTQRTRPEQLTRAIQLSSLAAPADGLGGSLKLYLSRFLHLVVDLEKEAEVDGQTVFYRIQEDRIFRSGELRYFDHPKFGVLAKVTRVDEDAGTQDTELLGYPAQ
jgi:hypothetical protein